MLRSQVLLRSPLLWRRSLLTVVLPNGKHLQRQSIRSQWRTLSSDTQKSSDTKTSDKNDANKTEADSTSDSKEIVLTPGEQVVAATRLGMWGGIFVFACVCGYYIVKELMPT
jgi:hypothetical protein